MKKFFFQMFLLYIFTAMVANGAKYDKRKEADIAYEKGLKYFSANNCFDEHGFPGRNVDGFIVPECAPDTLFRWVNKTGLETLRKSYAWTKPFFSPLFASFSPLSTYPYGQIPIRFKLRQGVKFKILAKDETREAYSTCLLNQDLPKNIIFVRSTVALTGPFVGKLIFWEYHVCSFNVFESITTFQPKSFREFIREKIYTDWLIKKGKLKNNLVSYLHTVKTGEAFPYMEKPKSDLEDISFDDIRWDRDDLENRLKALEKDFKRNKPLIYFNPNLKLNIPKEEQLKRHFSTTKPTFWNWETPEGLNK